MVGEAIWHITKYDMTFCIIYGVKWYVVLCNICDMYWFMICSGMWYVVCVTCDDLWHCVLCDGVWYVMCVLPVFTSDPSYSRGTETWHIQNTTALCPGLHWLTFGLSFFLMICPQSSFLQHGPIWYSLWNQLGKFLNVAFNNTESNGAMHVFDCMKIFTINILIIEERNTKQFRKWWL